MDKPILNLPKHLFWDVVFEDLDYEVSKNFVIVRVFERGDFPEITQLRRYYGDAVIIEALTKTKFLTDDRVLFFAGYFNILKTQFRCYNEKQLHHTHSLY